jgi:predicted kinase
MVGFVVWSTGLSGAGKSTAAAALSSEPWLRGVRVEILDSDEVRTHLSRDAASPRRARGRAPEPAPGYREARVAPLAERAAHPPVGWSQRHRWFS